MLVVPRIPYPGMGPWGGAGRHGPAGAPAAGARGPETRSPCLLPLPAGRPHQGTPWRVCACCVWTMRASTAVCASACWRAWAVCLTSWRCVSRPAAAATHVSWLRACVGCCASGYVHVLVLVFACACMRLCACVRMFVRACGCVYACEWASVSLREPLYVPVCVLEHPSPCRHACTPPPYPMWIAILPPFPLPPPPHPTSPFQDGSQVEPALRGGLAVDVLLLDIQMPVMNGDVLCQRLRSRGDCRPLVAVTGAHCTGPLL